jgi:hypothetical protein
MKPSSVVVSSAVCGESPAALVLPGVDLESQRVAAQLYLPLPTVWTSDGTISYLRKLPR